MPTPAWLTNQNVYFNETTTASMLIKTVSTDRHLIVWDALSDLDQQRLVDLVDAYGGSLPISATGGFQIVDIGGGVVGGDATGLANTTQEYTATVYVDGTPNAVTVIGNVAQDYTNLLARINEDLTGATATLDGDGNLRIDNDDVSEGTTLTITDTDLFSSLTDFVAINDAQIGVDDLESAMNVNKADNGQTFWSMYWSLIKICGTKPTFWGSHNYNDVYYDGTDWRHYVDDSLLYPP